MALFHRSIEYYMKKIVRMALDVKEDVEKGEFRKAITLLKTIVRLDIKLYHEIESETKSKELMEQALNIREAAGKAIEEVKEGEYDKLKEAINFIIKSGEWYLNSEEKFTGYKIEEYSRPYLRLQAKFLSDLIKGITTPQAERMLEISFENGLDLIIGGKSLKDNKIGGDLDIGFKVNKTHKDKIPVKNIRDVVTRVVNKINKKCFRIYQRILGHALAPHKWIHDKSALEGIPDIKTVEEFFMRVGFRNEPREVMKHGKPFGPSGYVVFYLTGKITLVTPIIKKESVVGKPKFW